jgi:predicted ABC-type ATPase
MVPRNVADPTITVLAGTNGAGKSSIGGELLRQAGVPYFNSDEVAREILNEHPGLPLNEANSLAWREEVRELDGAIGLRKDFAFESTLVGRTITAALQDALDAGLDVRIWYVGLESPDLHIACVRARVAQGGHPIPEDAIRKRFESSRLNLIRLMGGLTELKVFDNSAQADPHLGQAPEPRLLLHLRKGKVAGPSRDALKRTPEWAKCVVEAALSLGDKAN